MQRPPGSPHLRARPTPELTERPRAKSWRDAAALPGRERGVLLLIEFETRLQLGAADITQPATADLNMLKLLLCSDDRSIELTANALSLSY